MTSANLLLDFVPCFRYNEASKRGNQVRTVEQVVTELRKSEEAVKVAESARVKLQNELTEIYHTARQALGIEAVEPLDRQAYNS